MELKTLSVHIYPDGAACNSNLGGCADYQHAEDAIIEALLQLTNALSKIRTDKFNHKEP
jgi:hypothetical protein